jgi:hypothetical protein
MAMPTRTIEELRALVGDAGRDLSDAQLLRMADATKLHALIIVGFHLDQLNPEEARRRELRQRLMATQALAPRRARYARERERRLQKRRSA